MIRLPQGALNAAVDHAIGILRAAQRLDAAVASEVLQIIAIASDSERATYWVLEPYQLRLRALASWSAVTLSLTGPPRARGPSAASLCQANATHVWRRRKPVWSPRLAFDTGAPVFGRPGSRGGVWFAVKTDTFVYGVIELLGLALEPGAPENLAILERLGFRLGQTVEELRHDHVRLH